MAADLEYFRLCRDTDPTYEVKHAIVEYLHGDFDEARELANELCDDCFNNPDARLLDVDEVYDLVNLMEPIDAFNMGRLSDDIDTRWYYTIDGQGYFEKVLEPWDYLKGILYDGWKHIVNGEFEISDDLQSVIDVFTEEGGRSNNMRSSGSKRSGTVRRSAPKKKASKPKASSGRPKASQCRRATATKKTTKPKASANRAPARRR